MTLSAALCPRAVMLVGLLLGLVVSGPAQEQPKKGDAPSVVGFGDLEIRGRADLTAATMIGLRDGLAAIVAYRHGEGQGAWIAAPLPKTPVRRVHDPLLLDKERLVGIEDGRLRPSFQENPDEYRSYLYVIGYVHDVPTEAMARAVNKDITYTHLVEHPSRYRGEVVRVTGKLRQLRKWDAPRSLWNDGIKDFYEGLIESDLHYAQRYYVVLSEMPAEIKPGDRLDYPVTCYAYFFKRAYLESREGSRQRAPFLVGRGLILRQDPPPPPLEESSYFDSPGGLVCVGLGVTACLVAGLIWWFRRGDRAVQARLATTRVADWTPPPESPAELATIFLHQPDAVLKDRVESIEFATYIERLRVEVEAYLTGKPTGAGQALTVVCAVKPERERRFWVEANPGPLDPELVKGLVERLEDNRPPAVRSGYVSCALMFKLWGGRSEEGGWNAVPAEWQQVTATAKGESLSVPDGILARLWP